MSFPGAGPAKNQNIVAGGNNFTMHQVGNLAFQAQRQAMAADFIAILESSEGERVAK